MVMVLRGDLVFARVVFSDIIAGCVAIFVSPNIHKSFIFNVVTSAVLQLHM